MRANTEYMTADMLKMAYVQSRVSDNALVQSEAGLRNRTTLPNASASEMLKTLETAFGDPDHDQTAQAKYCALR